LIFSENERVDIVDVVDELDVVGVDEVVEHSRCSSQEEEQRAVVLDALPRNLIAGTLCRFSISRRWLRDTTFP
jgi:hypothetical protein